MIDFVRNAINGLSRMCVHHGMVVEHDSLGEKVVFDFDCFTWEHCLQWRMQALECISINLAIRDDVVSQEII